jgi:hypothetical protein
MRLLQSARRQSFLPLLLGSSAVIAPIDATRTNWMQASSLTPVDLRFAMFAVKQALAASSALLNLDLTMAAFAFGFHKTK